MNIYNPTYYYIDNFILDRIVYEKPLNSQNIVLFAYSDTKSEPLLTEYLCDFNILTDILIAGGKATESVIKNLSEQIKDSSDEPINMQIKSDSGVPVEINNIKLKIYRPMEQKENGEWVECFTRDLFFIIEKAADDFDETELKIYRENMINAYGNYLKAKESGYPVFQARDRAGLKYELIFRLSYQIYNNVQGSIGN